MTSLVAHIDGTRANSRAYLEANPAAASLLHDIESTFPDVLGLPSLAARGPLMFLAMAHATYLSAVALSTSGQLPASYMASRGILEASIYAWWTSKRPELKAVWSNRDDSPEAEKLVRNSFKIGDIRVALKENMPAFENQFGIAYDQTISMGAHPNAAALWTNMTDPDENGDSTYLYINTDAPARPSAVLTAAFCALTGLTISLDTFPELLGTDVPGRIVELTGRCTEVLP
jgi:hypothetical protein